MGVDKRSAVIGFVGGFLSLCTIGFFILLGVVLTGDDAGAPAARAVAARPTNVAAPSAPTPAAPSAPTPGNIDIALSDDDFIKGDVDAPITLVEYSDLECPFCERFHPTAEQVVADNDGKVNWVYRHFPLRSIHPTAARKAEASECAGEIAGGAGFWGVVDGIFEGAPASTDDQLADLAAQHGADRGAFTECLNSGRGAELVQQDESSGLAAGAQGTPYSVIVGPNGETFPVSGALPAAQIQQIIDGIDV